MDKKTTETQVTSDHAVCELLLGSQAQATWTLRGCGIQSSVIQQLIQDSQNPDFDSGLYKPSNLDEPLSGKLWIVAAEMFFQIHRCRRAVEESRWSDAIEVAWLLGEARGSLFRMAAQQAEGRKAAEKSAAKKIEKWNLILKTALEINAAEAATLPGSRVKLDYLYSKVRAQLKRKVKPFPVRSSFAAHWSKLQTKIDMHQSVPVQLGT